MLDFNPANVRDWGAGAMTAIAIEAGTAETTKIDSVHEHAMAKPDAQDIAHD